MSTSESTKKQPSTKANPKVGKGAGRGGYRPGSGRKPGKQDQTTLDRIEAMRQFRERVSKRVDEFYNAQFSLAVGTQYLYRIDTQELDNGKTKRVHVLVTDPEEIKNALDGDLGQVGESFYYLTTQTPNNQAIDSMLDRTFGKAQQSVDLTSKGNELNGVIALPAREVVDLEPSE